MLAGYVTYNELKLITGFSEKFLNRLILRGLNIHEVDLDYRKLKSNYKQMLFNLAEVEEWLKVHIF